jgi:septum formation inhibitor-activating ATPase MinD
MRIVRYSSTLQIEPWLSYDLVPQREVKETDLPKNTFDKIVDAIKAARFAYVVVDQPSEVLIERADGT